MDMAGKIYPKMYREAYHKLSKTELFYVALSYYELQNSEYDEANFIKFVKKDSGYWIGK